MTDNASCVRNESSAGTEAFRALSDAELEAMAPEGLHLTADFIRESLFPLAALVLRKFQEFRAKEECSGVFIVIIAGGVSSGKTSAALMLKRLLAALGLRTETVSSDGFIYPSAWLQEHNLMDQKGFPVSYDARYMEEFLKEVRAASQDIRAPRYSHKVYDRLPDDWQIIPRDTDILIFEGVNLLAAAEEYGVPGIKAPLDYADLSIYIDVPEHLAESWHRERCLSIIRKNRGSPQSFFSRYAGLSEPEVIREIRHVWETINHVNLMKFIKPYAGKAHIRVTAGPDHRLSKPEWQNGVCPETEDGQNPE